MLDHVVRRGAISQIPNTWDKWGREWVSRSYEFSVIFISVSVFCFSGAAVKGACSVLVVLQFKMWLFVFPFISV